MGTFRQQFSWWYRQADRSDYTVHYDSGMVIGLHEIGYTGLKLGCWHTLKLPSFKVTVSPNFGFKLRFLSRQHCLQIVGNIKYNMYNFHTGLHYKINAAAIVC